MACRTAHAKAAASLPSEGRWVRASTASPSVSFVGAPTGPSEAMAFPPRAIVYRSPLNTIWFRMSENFRAASVAEIVFAMVRPFKVESDYQISREATRRRSPVSLSIHGRPARRTRTTGRHDVNGLRAVHWVHGRHAVAYHTRRDGGCCDSAAAEVRDDLPGVTDRIGCERGGVSLGHRGG